MLPLMRLRGPDSEGLDSWGGTVLGHRRLAILDLSPLGHQPMLSDDQQVGVVFNGCIYNFRSLRNELETLGHRFRSECDTEVLLRGYEQWGGRALVRRLRGMYAFAIWDQRQRALTLARDRMGVKPLVYWTDGTRLAFASSASALRAGLGEEADRALGEYDPEAVLELFEYGFVPEQRAIWRNLRKLPPSTVAEWRQGRWTEEKYWELPEPEPSGKIRFEEAVEQTESLLEEAVRLRLQSDVPVGALLSGGVDSALVCWAMAKANASVRTFTVTTPGDSQDEAAAAAETARILGLPHQTVEMGMGSESDVLPEVLDAYGEPFASMSATGMLRVSRAVRAEATVLLTGDGGDDIHLGYPLFLNAWRGQRVAALLPPFAPALWRMARPLTSGGMRTFLNYATGGVGEFARAHGVIEGLRGRRALGPALDRAVITRMGQPASLASARRLVADVTAYHWNLHFTGEFMTKVDGATTWHSLEARAPFLDHVLWEHAARLPVEARLRGGMMKAILRDIVARRVSPAVGQRRKQGFIVPLTRWLAREPEQLRILLNGRLRQGGWIRPEGVERLIEEGRRRGEVGEELWRMLVLEHWLERKAAPRIERAA
jgi:asparagine synthase (glutamine-hydrolysing)